MEAAVSGVWGAIEDLDERCERGELQNEDMAVAAAERGRTEKLDVGGWWGGGQIGMAAQVKYGRAGVSNDG